jgi:hypothetical protein
LCPVPDIGNIGHHRPDLGRLKSAAFNAELLTAYEKTGAAVIFTHVLRRQAQTVIQELPDGIEGS